MIRAPPVTERGGRASGPGVFTLPTQGSAESPYRVARELIISALTRAPGNQATTAELISETGRPRSAIDAALFRLIEQGDIVRIRRGVFELPRSAARRRAQTSRGAAS
jgi:DNA-binding transcriptional regulator PaaX